MVSGEKLEDWIKEVRKCIEDLLKEGKWKESDICIILTNGILINIREEKQDWIKYVRFYLKLKSR
jgi:hypothetical protein